MLPSKTLLARMTCGVAGATALLGCASTENLGTRPTRDASPDDDGSVVAPELDAAATETGADTSVPTHDAGATSARIVLFGGTDGVSYLNDTWTFDGTAWTLLNISGPPARSGMVSATVGGKMVVFGGNAGTGADGGSVTFDDTWVFDGASWAKLALPTAPSARGGSGVAVIDDALYLYGGGGSAGSFLTDTWKFDGAAWTQVSTNGPTGPTPTRDVFAMGPMAGGHGAVFFGGDTSTGDFQNDTWTFDGTTWTHVTTATSPSQRALGVIVPWSGGALQWGGNTAVGPNDTWTFDGANWTQVNTPPPGGANGPCGASAAVLDAKVVLFGGYCASPADTTYVFDGTSWSLVDFTNHPFVPSARTGAAMVTLP